MKRGFTLIEILAVVVILAIAAKIAISYMGSYSGLKVTAAARMTMSDLFYAQNTAITKQTNVFVIFRTSGNVGYDLAYKSNPSASADYVVNPLKGGNYTVVFGASATGPAAYATVQSVTRQSSGSPVAMSILTFDSLGQPGYCSSGDTSGTLLTDTAAVNLGATATSSPTTLTIQPYTGEISTP